MPNHAPIGACCARPRFGDVGDDHNETRKSESIAIIGIFAMIAVLFACALLLSAR